MSLSTGPFSTIDAKNTLFMGKTSWSDTCRIN
jgi:hypothetical protein